jgi:hypothetical protein
MIDPLHEAVRGDLVDVALADRVFAPHYARGVPHQLTCSTGLLDAPDGRSVGDVTAGATFDLLDISGAWAWGRCPDSGIVGYLPADCVAPL